MERKRWAFPIVGVAAVRRGGETRVALAGVAPIPWLLARRARRCDSAAAERVQGRRRPRAREARTCDDRRMKLHRLCSSRSSLLTACGGKKEAASLGTTNATTTVDSDGCHAIKTPNPEKRTRAEAHDHARRGEDLRRDARDELRQHHDQARREGLAEDDSVIRQPRPPPLLHRHDLPPDHPGLRDPGRRPDRHRHRRSRLHDRRSAAGVDQVHGGRRRDGEDGREAPGTADSQFFIVIGPDAATLPPVYALLGNVTPGSTSRSGSATSATRIPEQLTALIEIEKATVDVH